MDLAYLRRALELAERYDFVIASDECYADIYDDESRPPPSLLTAAAAMGNAQFTALHGFHTVQALQPARPALGLRGRRCGADATVPALSHLPRLRHAGAHAARQHRRLERRCARDRPTARCYRDKFDRVLPILAPVLEAHAPDGGFYLWPNVGGDDEAFTPACMRSRTSPCCPAATWRARRPRGNPGAGYVRISLVAPGSRMCAGCPPDSRLHHFDQGRLMNDTNTLRRAIEAAYEKRADLTPSTIDAGLRQAIEDCIGLLDSGQARVAEKSGDAWVVNDWLKKAVLLYFRANDNQVIDAGTARYYDKVPLKFADQDAAQFRAGGVRVVPHAMVRRGAYIAPNVVLMPCYVNIGAYVDAGTMVDTWSTVGLLRADRPQRAPLRRRRHRRRARAAAGDARPSSRTTASSARARKWSRA